MNETWLLVEDGRLVNVGMLSDIRFNEHERRASAWSCETPVYANSSVLFEYFWPIRQELEAKRQARPRQVHPVDTEDAPKES